VLLTATPHSGDRRAFASLCSVGTTGEPSRDHDKLLVFRRSRADVGLAGRRRIHRLAVRMSRDEARMHELLRRFSAAVRGQHHDRASEWCLALGVLHKRAVSSAWSLHESVERRLAALAQPIDALFQTALPFADASGELTASDEAPHWPHVLSLRNPVQERRLLGALASAASRAARQETKIAFLVRLLRRVAEPAIVFTEYRDTLLHVQTSLACSSAVLHGGMSREQRRTALERFVRGEARVLLATDAAGEGLNLQHACRLVINLELPWNPMRLEQRIGRVDRIGQRRTVHAVHLIARDSAETEVLARLHRRTVAARVDVGGSDPLGLDMEEEIVRLVVGGRAGVSGSVEATGCEPSPVPISKPALAVEAEDEVRRTLRARRYAGSADGVAGARADGCGPLTMRARRWRTRAVLAGRVCLVWRLVVVEASGRHVGSTVLATLVDEWTSSTQHAAKEAAITAAAAWRHVARRTQRRFVARRLARERALERNRVSPAFQPGLFDQRAERALRAAMLADLSADRDRAERVRRAKGAAALTFLPPELVLVLTP
jgi:hypothetical protein